MLKLLLFRFWPVFIPVAIYLLWRFWCAVKARRYGQPPPSWSKSHGYWLLIAVMMTGLGCMIFWGITTEQNRGAYIPTMEEDGRVIPGRWE